jgi:hypothetical protein
MTRTGKRNAAGILVIVAALACLAVTAQAQTVVTPRTTEVSLFKNGLGFVTREFTVPSGGEYLLKGLPVPAHGTFWILSDQAGSAVKEAVAFSSPRTEPIEALSLQELIQANVGRKVEVRTDGEGWVAGTVLATPERTPKLPLRASGDSSRGYYGYYGYGGAYRPPTAQGEAQEAQFVLIKTDKGVMALPPAEIKGVRAEGANLATSVSHSEPGAALRMKVTGPGGRFRIAYLEWGLTWAPSYRIDITDPKRASLACKAEVINDVEELKSTKMNFVTGFPNLAFSEAVSPLAMIGDVSDFIQSLISLGTHRARPDVTMNQVVMQQAAGPGVSGSGHPTLPEEGETREDLFLYPQPDVTLSPGERGYYQLFTREVPYKDVYEWEIGDSLDEGGRWRYAGSWEDQRNRAPEQEEVWHSLRLTNTGDTPWTTAPAMTVQQGSILGQDTLYYTSPGGQTTLKITRSMDVKAEKSEKEADRQRGVKPPYYASGNWDLVTIEGELRVRNYKNKSVTLLVKKTLSGEVLADVPKAQVEARAEGVWHLNPQQVLTWEIPLQPGGKASLTYRYKAYVAR